MQWGRIKGQNYLEDGNLLAGVDDPGVHGVGTGQVDHLAEHHPVVRLGVHVVPVAGQRQFVGHVAVAVEGVVDPVSEGDLLLIKDGVGPELPVDLLSFLHVGGRRRREGVGDALGLERLADLEQAGCERCERE